MIEITNVNELGDHLTEELTKFMEYADVDFDDIAEFIQHCRKDAEY